MQKNILEEFEIARSLRVLYVRFTRFHQDFEFVKLLALCYSYLN